MIELFKTPNFDFLGKAKIFITLTMIISLLGILSFFVKGFNMGIDFAGGTLLNVRFKNSVDDSRIRNALAAKGIDITKVTIQPISDRLGDSKNEVLIRMPITLSDKKVDDKTLSDKKVDDEIDANKKLITKALYESYGDTGEFSIVNAETVGPQVGRDLRNRAIYVTLAALLGMLIYVAYRFEWIYGVAAVAAVFHDVLFTLTFFSLFNWEISLNVLASLLSLIGYSMNDTIVIFDRIREKLKSKPMGDINKISNEAINETLSRTLITSGLTFFSVLALLVFGGPVLRGFSLALFIGIIVGTYSSIFIATPIMLWGRRFKPQRHKGHKDQKE